MSERGHWPWTAFRIRNEYARLPPEDLPNLPHELNPYERFVIRFAFASKALLICLVVGLVYGSAVALVNWRFGTWIIP